MVFGLVWASFRHIQVIGLGLGQGGELHPQFFEVVAGDLLVQMLWHHGPSYRPTEKEARFGSTSEEQLAPARPGEGSGQIRKGGNFPF